MKFFRGLQICAILFCAAAAATISGCTPARKIAVSNPPTKTIAVVPSQNSLNANTNTSATIPPNVNVDQTTSAASPTTSSANTDTSGGEATNTASDQTMTANPTTQTPALVKLGSTSSSASYLNESLSLLGYMPVQFKPAHGVSKSGAMATMSQSQAPIPGGYSWKQKASAKSLAKLWKPLADNVITQGALMRFQADHHIIVDGIAGPQVWNALKQALNAKDVTKQPYVFITVDEHPTEVLKVWSNGKVVLQTAANTGISQSPTSIGTWPIYLRYRAQEMRGTTPWGTTYDDPGVPYVNYFHGGEAVHGFPRSSYGYPQSMGCVEIPVPAAKKLYSMVGYGTLVTVRK